jgi:hypothetical protein
MEVTSKDLSTLIVGDRVVVKFCTKNGLKCILHR